MGWVSSKAVLLLQTVLLDLIADGEGGLESRTVESSRWVL